MSDPLKWSDAVCRAIMILVTRYVAYWAGELSPRTLDREAREEVVSRIMFDIITGGAIPDGISDERYAFRWCRLWRVRNWYGNTAADQALRRFEDRIRKARESGRGVHAKRGTWERTESTGASADAKTPAPDAILSAVESVTGELILSPAARAVRIRRGLPLRKRGGCMVVSDRQRKQRRRAVKGRCRTIIVVEIESRATDRTYIRFRKVRLATTRYIGSVPSRSIGRTRLDGPELNRHRCNAAVRYRDKRGRFAPAPVALVPLPAMAGDGTESRPWDGTDRFNARGFRLRHWIAPHGSDAQALASLPPVAQAGLAEFVAALDAECLAHGID